ncbi:class F sortase [Streptomyces sp. A244]|uniref:class F sortase n=1 Tax=Streptomyces sp. A244 TaxID=2137016 RepID=UPI00215972A0|nr:class F sortase [Streptomyces sp. A244]
MADGRRRLTGPMVAAAALAAVLGFPATPSQPAASPPDAAAAPPERGIAAAVDAARPERGNAAAPEAAPGTAQDPPPRRVLVPRTGLDAEVGPVGVTDRGDMAVPDDPSRAGWYRYGPAPGSDRGSAVLVGHVDSESGDLGEFLALYDVRRGDRVEVRRAGGGPVHYRVVSRVTVPKDDLPPSVFRRSGAPVLTLITCAPPYDPERGYVSNLVVTAEPVESRPAGNGRAK